MQDNRERGSSGSEDSSDPLIGMQSVTAEPGKQMRIQSLCTNCGGQGETRLVFVDIPKFGSTTVSSFRCKHCGFSGRDVQQLGDIQNKGVELTLEVRNAADVSRGVVKSSTCTVAIPAIGLEIEPRPMSGSYTTVEGLLRSAANNLSLMQPERKIKQPDVAEKIDQIIQRLLSLLEAANQLKETSEQPIFTIKLTDPSGNSFIEPIPELNHVKEVKFDRSMGQAQQLGLTEAQERKIQAESNNIQVHDEVLDSIELGNDHEITQFTSPCPMCGEPVDNKNCIVNIPYFKDVLLMAMHCDGCGYKSVEIQQAGAISKLGRKIVLRVTDPSDLSREVMKSSSCTVRIYEVGVQLEPGSLGGLYTTLEGLVRQIQQELTRHSQFWFGDGARSQEESERWKELLLKLDLMASGKMNFTIEIDDPLDGSFIKNIYAPEPDPAMTVTSYERTKEQNEELGLDGLDTGADE